MQDAYSHLLLLWTVVVIASRGSRKNYGAEGDLCLQLAPAVKRLVAEQAVIARPSLFSIQALLLLCCWPLPSEFRIGNPIWMYCGMATHQALLHGLHRPLHVAEYDYSIIADENVLATMTRTWIACFVVNQKYVTSLT